jgi:hypothetical protein
LLAAGAGAEAAAVAGLATARAWAGAGPGESGEAPRLRARNSSWEGANCAASSAETYADTQLGRLPALALAARSTTRAALAALEGRRPCGQD